MINLVSPDVRRSALWEYWARVASVWAFLVGSAFIAIVMLLVPAYVTTSIQLKALGTAQNKHAGDQQSYTDAQAAIVRANTVAGQLTKSERALTMTTVLEALDRATSKNIILRHIIVNRVGGKISGVTVQGTASSRIALADFQKALERDALFSSARVPTSDLARATDLPFAIDVTIDTNAQ